MRNDYFIIIAIVLVALTVVFLPGWMPVQAATPAEPEVIPCQTINSAGLIFIYRCTPEQGAPYLLNSLGFMLNEE